MLLPTLKEQTVPRVVVVSACRTPQGRFLGGLASSSAAQLGAIAAEAALARASIAPDAIDQVIVGNVLGAGLGQNVARQIALGARVPVASPAFTVNMMCASGLQAVALAAQAIAAQNASVVLCGGVESMSRAPYLLERARTGYKLGHGNLVDSILRDGLTDSFTDKHMGECLESMARQKSIGRSRQDAFALRSQERAAAAKARGAFADELVAVGKVTEDEHPRADTTLAGLSALKPAFADGGTVTAGNASGINDGAAMLVVCSETTAKAHGWKPLAVFAGCASAGCEPEQFGIGPVLATRALCDRYGYTLGQFDTVELNEAFAAQALACIDGLALDADKVNPDGGAIALGHPIGASGARLVVHLAHRIARGESSRALATLCVGGGMGIAAALETYR
jgi:acetyl-CoA C-acetyltransferase